MHRQRPNYATCETDSGSAILINNYVTLFTRHNLSPKAIVSVEQIVRAFVDGQIDGQIAERSKT
jgi:hypothetical protein